jgi:hypothetical protein
MKNKKAKANPYAGAIDILEAAIYDWDDEDDKETPKSCKAAIELLKKAGKGRRNHER